MAVAPAPVLLAANDAIVDGQSDLLPAVSMCDQWVHGHLAVACAMHIGPTSRMLIYQFTPSVQIPT